jgi:hypothetical protein
MIRHLKLACDATDEGWSQGMQTLRAVVPGASAAWLTQAERPGGKMMLIQPAWQGPSSRPASTTSPPPRLPEPRPAAARILDLIADWPALVVMWSPKSRSRNGVNAGTREFTLKITGWIGAAFNFERKPF